MPVAERMRPSLGTFVTIRAEDDDADVASLYAAIDSAFRTIDRVDRLMSAHRAASDIGRINSARVGRRLRVHRWTFAVLERSHWLRTASGGAFDCDIGQALERSRLLPRRPGRRRSGGQLFQVPAITLAPGCTVHVKRSVNLDLGGIAKGFAVDRAVEALRSHGVRGGIVNAGGDLRVFGERPHAIWTRDACSPTSLAPLGLLCGGAVATTAAYFTPRGTGRVIDARRDRPAVLPSSTSVIARTCMDADALTKVVAIRGRLPLQLARKLHARVASA